MAKVTVGNSTCRPIRGRQGAPLSHRACGGRCQVVTSPLAVSKETEPHVFERFALAPTVLDQRIENTTDTSTVSSSEPDWIGTLDAARSAAASGAASTGPTS